MPNNQQGGTQRGPAEKEMERTQQRGRKTAEEGLEARIKKKKKKVQDVVEEKKKRERERERYMSPWPRYFSLVMAFMCMRRILIRFRCFAYFHPY